MGVTIPDDNIRTFVRDKRRIMQLIYDFLQNYRIRPSVIWRCDDVRHVYIGQIEQMLLLIIVKLCALLILSSTSGEGLTSLPCSSQV